MYKNECASSRTWDAGDPQHLSFQFVHPDIFSRGLAHITVKTIFGTRIIIYCQGSPYMYWKVQPDVLEQCRSFQIYVTQSNSTYQMTQDSIPRIWNVEFSDDYTILERSVLVSVVFRRVAEMWNVNCPFKEFKNSRTHLWPYIQIYQLQCGFGSSKYYISLPETLFWNEDLIGIKL